MQSDRDSRKSTSGYVFTFGGGAVSWKSIKQSCIADSTTEAEYVATSEAIKEVVWLWKFLQDLEVVPSATNTLVLYNENSGGVAQSKELKNHKSHKHIERKYHIIREIMQHGEIKVTKIATTDNAIDPFTKAITRMTLNQHLESMGIRDMLELL